MNNPEQNLDQRALFWAKLKQRGEQLAQARTALIEGRLPAARRLFLESHELEQAAQQLAANLTIGTPPALVATTLNQATQEAYTAIVQGELSTAADIRMRFESIAEIEQALPGSLPAKALILLPQALVEKSRQALHSKQFERAEEYLDQLIAQGKTSTEIEMLRTNTMLARARHLRTNDGNTEQAQILLDRARIANETMPAGAGVANWRTVFEREVAEEQTALYFAAGEQAQRQWQFRRARQQYGRVPPASAYGPQARARVAAIDQNLRLALFGILVMAAIAGFFVLQRFRSPPTVTANTPVPTAASIAQTTVIIVTATAEPTVQPTVGSTATTMPATAPVIQQLRVSADQLVIYRNPVRRNSERAGTLRVGTVLLQCGYSATEGTYQVADKSCDTPLGWVNQNFVDIITPTPTP